MNALAHFAPMLGYGFLGAFALFTALWIVQVIRRDAGVVDIGWTAGVGLMAVAAAAFGEGWLPRKILVGAMGGVWAGRLVIYILKDRVLREKEDSRYQRLRAYWGSKAHFWFFFFFTSQSLLVVLFALPFLAGASNTTAAWTIFDALALATWGLAMGGEWLADFQLTRFRRNPANAGRVCRDGLWNWSRHPNYFFECVHWVAYVFAGVAAPGFALTLIGPLAMYAFLMKITGIPHVERESLAKRGEAYRAYQRVTNRLVPWPPRKERA